jgi:hypothetical protein
MSRIDRALRLTHERARPWRTRTNEEHTVKYLLMMHVPGRGPYQMSTWARKDLDAHLEFLRQFNRQLSAAGELVGIEALTAPDRAKLIRAGKDGAPVTDGPFPEAKEFLAGYWIVDVDSPERAYQLAAEASAAPGPGGVPLHMAIEVREVMAGPPTD